MHTCKFCNKTFLSGQSLGGHINNCKANPDFDKIYLSKSQKISKANIGKKLSIEQKEKISKSRTKYLLENPDKVPYRLNHSSKISYPEKTMIKYLNEFKIMGWIHQMQFSIYEIDFAFPEYKLAVEIDGHTHTLPKFIEKDKRKDKFLNDNEWKVLRITASDIRNNIYECINRIQSKLDQKLIDIPIEFLNKQYLKNEKILEIQNKKLNDKNLKLQKIQTMVDTILKSDIDFSKFGWVNHVALLLNMRHQKIKKWMITYMNDFYTEKCYKRK